MNADAGWSHQNAGFPAAKYCLRLLGGFAGVFGLEGRAAPAFPQVGDACSDPCPPKTAQKPRLMAKSGPIFCKTVQKSWDIDIVHRAVAVETDPRRRCAQRKGRPCQGLRLRAFVRWGDFVCPCVVGGLMARCRKAVVALSLRAIVWVRFSADIVDLGKRCCFMLFWARAACKTAQKMKMRHRERYRRAHRFILFPPSSRRPAGSSRKLFVVPLRTPKAGAMQDCNRLAEWGRLAPEDRSGPAAAVPVGSRHKSHVMRRWTRGWDAYSTERSPAQLNAKVVLEPPFGAATLPIMNRRSCIGAARKGCSCVFSNPGWA